MVVVRRKILISRLLMNWTRSMIHGLLLLNITECGILHLFLEVRNQEDGVYQSITLVDANAFGLQWANMKSIIAESVKYADMVIFNRCKSGMDLGSYKEA